MVWIILFILIAVVIWVSYFLSQIGTKGANTAVDTTRSGGFKANLPEGFAYAFFHDNTGYAINMKTKEALLLSRGVEKKVSLDKIRTYEKRWNTPSKQKITSNTMIGASQQISSNRSLARQAYESSGLFISIPDIDAPVVQILFPDEVSLNKAFEIFSQAREGILPDKA